MEYTKKPAASTPVHPRIIIHGGAGNITRENLPKQREREYERIMLAIVESGQRMLAKGGSALDVAVHVVTLMEDDEHFNCSKGAVFNRDGMIELEASVMVTHGHRKRGVGCMLLKRTKNPIKLAREMLIRGDAEDGKGGGAYGHSQLSGNKLEELAEEWGLDMVDNSYFHTPKRWQEHKRGLEREKSIHAIKDSATTRPKADHHVSSYEYGGTGDSVGEYLPQGTVGAVVLDDRGVLCVATSTGGMTNKLTGRIGDTPTLGAGFWAEEWNEHHTEASRDKSSTTSWSDQLFSWSGVDISDCLPVLEHRYVVQRHTSKRAVAMSGTGNGDSFLRTAAVRTAAAMTRFSNGSIALAEAVTRVAGPRGELQVSAGDRWGETGEGECGIIGIDVRNGRGEVVWDLNCGGMFRAWVNDDGLALFQAFRD